MQDAFIGRDEEGDKGRAYWAVNGKVQIHDQRSVTTVTCFDAITFVERLLSDEPDPGLRPIRMALLDKIWAATPVYLKPLPGLWDGRVIEPTEVAYVVRVSNPHDRPIWTKEKEDAIVIQHTPTLWEICAEIVRYEEDIDWQHEKEAQIAASDDPGVTYREHLVNKLQDCMERIAREAEAN